MSLSNSTSLAELVGEIVSRDVQKAAYANRVMRDLVRSHQLPPGAGSMVIPRFLKVPVAALTEGVAPAETALDTVGQTLTPVERGTYVKISKRLLHADPFSDLAPYGAELGRSLAEDEDKQILDAMDFTTDVTGELDQTVFLDAISTLEGLNVPGPYFAVFNPATWAKLRATFSDAATFASVGTRVVEGFGKGFTNANGFVGQPYGIPSFITTQVTGGKIFGQQSTAVGWIRQPGVDVDDNVVSRALDLMAWHSIDAVKLVDEYGVNITDAV